MLTCLSCSIRELVRCRRESFIINDKLLSRLDEQDDSLIEGTCLCCSHPPQVFPSFPAFLNYLFIFLKGEACWGLLLLQQEVVFGNHLSFCRRHILFSSLETFCSSRMYRQSCCCCCLLLGRIKKRSLDDEKDMADYDRGFPVTETWVVACSFGSRVFTWIDKVHQLLVLILLFLSDWRIWHQVSLYTGGRIVPSDKWSRLCWRSRFACALDFSSYYS